MVSRKALMASSDLEWAGRRLMEFRTAVYLVNWLQEEGLLKEDLNAVTIAEQFTSGDATKARKLFNDALRQLLDGALDPRALRKYRKK